MSVGLFFQRAFGAIVLKPIVILTLALVIGALPGLVMSYAFVQLGLGSPEALRTGAIPFRGYMGLIFIAGVINLIISALVQGALTRATVSANEGVRATFGESLSAGLRVLFPLIGLSILWGIGVG